MYCLWNLAKSDKGAYSDTLITITLLSVETASTRLLLYLQSFNPLYLPVH